MAKILTKGAPITWRCHIPLTLVLVCIFVLWFSLTKSQPGTVPIHNLESLYGCRQPQLLRMFGFPSLKNCSHSMLQQKATTKTFCGEVLWYSSVVITFQLYHCMFENITIAYHCDNIFARKIKYRTLQSVLLPGCSCLQAGLNYTVPISCDNKTLTKVNHWNIPVTLA